MGVCVRVCKSVLVCVVGVRIAVGNVLYTGVPSVLNIRFLEIYLRRNRVM